MTRFTIRSWGAILLVMVAMDCSAQFGSGMGGMRRGSAGMPGSSAPYTPSAPQPSRVEQITSRLYDLRMRLLISPAQTAAWDAFHDRFFEFAAAGTRVASAPGEQSALQAMQQQLGLAQDRYAMAESLNEATRLLLAALTPEQQRLADQMIPALLAEPPGDRERRSPSR